MLVVTHEAIRSERRILPGAARRMRQFQRKTQAELATKAGIDFTTLSHIEKGRQPSLENMCKLADALGVDLDDITYIATVYVADGAA
jgi:transcriptional regulator with XRE-family HTH domain